MSEAITFERDGTQLKSQRYRYLWAVFCFCAATSIPMSFCFYVLPASMRAAGQSAEAIGLVALVYIPYALRAIWAPLIDLVTKGSPLVCRRIVLGATLAANIIILLLSFSDPAESLVSILAVSILMFVCLSTGMTALDGYVLGVIEQRSRAKFSGWQAAGFTSGAIVLGLQSIALEDSSWVVKVAVMAGSMAVLAIPLVLLPIHNNAIHFRVDPLGSLTMGQFLRRAEVLKRALLSVLTHGSFGMVVGYMPILMVDSGLSAGQAGLFGTVGSNVVGLAASVLIGVVTVRLGAWRSIQWVSLAGAFILSSGVFIVQDPRQGYIIALSLAMTGLAYAFVVPYRALVLQLSAGKRRATQAATLSSLDVLISIVAASLAGVTVHAIGLPMLLLLATFACCLGTLIARAATRTHRNPNSGNL